MLAVTGWALATWLKSTLLLAVLVGGAWLIAGTSSGWFWVVLVGAGALEVWAVRQLAREWVYEARSSWWWAP